MSALIFPDNTVLCNFAAVERIDLLMDWLRGRGRWCAAVHREASDSSAHLPDLLQLLGKDSPLGEPIDVPSEFNELIESIRINVFGGLPAQPRRHLGEAQSCVILTAVHEYRGSWWVTDDVDAYEYAKRKNMFTYRTRDVFAHLVADGEVTAQEALTLMRDMQEQGRGLSMPANVDELTNG